MSISRNRKNILTFLRDRPTYTAGCTYKWLSRVTTLNGVSQKIRHYIDEETKPEGRAWHTKEINADELPKSTKDFIEHKRHSHVRGFLIEKVQERTGIAPHLMEPISMLKEVDNIWKDELVKNGHNKQKAAMHSAMIALSPEYCKLLHDSGKDIDEYILDITSKTMRHLSDYLRKYYDKQEGKKNGNRVKNRKEDFRLGYLVGVHHDRKHIHAHIAIFPYTASGKFVKIASEHRKGKGYDAYNELRNFARNYALEKFKREIYAPAYMVEKGEDQVWQRQLLLSKGYNEITLKSRGVTGINLAQQMYAYADDLSNLSVDKFSKKVGEAYTWAENRFKALKDARVTQEEIDGDKSGLFQVYKESRELATEIPKESRVLERIQAEYEIVNKKISEIEEDILYSSNTPNEADDINAAVYNSAMSDDEDTEEEKAFAKIMSDIFDLLEGKYKNASMMKLFLGILKGIYKESDKEEKRKLKKAVRPKYANVGDKDVEDGKKLLLEKLKDKRAKLFEDYEKRDTENNDRMDKLRLLHYKHTSGMLDVYFKENILHNRKPLLFAPQIRDIVLTRAGGLQDVRSEVSEVMADIRKSSQALRNTPEVIYNEVKDILPADSLDKYVKAAPESIIAESVKENEKLSHSTEFII